VDQTLPWGPATLLTLLLPSPCLACDQPIPRWRPLLGLCVPCRCRLVGLRNCCAQCGAPLSNDRLPPHFRCGACRLDPPSFDRLEALYLYQPPLDAVVRHLKFAGLPYLGRHAAALLVRHLGTALRQIEVVVPVPLHWRRAIRRGYNQAREISLPLAQRSGRPHHQALRLVRATRPQAELDRADRRDNPIGAFRVHRPSAIAGRHVLLVDDVVTTGATLNASARALKEAGATEVTVAVLGRTPPPGYCDHLAPATTWQDS